MSKTSHVVAPMGEQIKKTPNYITPIALVLIITVALMVLMNAFKAVEQDKDDEVIIPTIEVFTIQSVDYVVPITTEGMVLPQTSISFASEIMGKVVKISDNFSNGGAFVFGEVLVEIDPKDYELVIARSLANVASAQASLDLEQAKTDLASDDWKKYGKKGKPSALNLNLPQVASAKAALDAAKAELSLAKRNLEKTKVIAPFDGVILSKSVDVGQFVSTGLTLATLASTEMAEIRVALTDEQLNQSGLINSVDGTQVTITSDETDQTLWHGTVKHIEAQRDSRTLMNYVIIEVPKPFTQQEKPLRFNTFVSVQFSGVTLVAVYPLKREYMRINSRVNLLNSQSQLSIQSVEVAYADDEWFYISKGLKEVDQVITTQLPSIKAGRQLKLYNEMKPSIPVTINDEG